MAADKVVNLRARKMILIKGVLHGILGCYLCLACGHALADGEDGNVSWFSDLEISASYKDNFGHAERSRDIVSDNAVLVNYSFVSNIELKSGNSIALKAFAEHEQVNTLDDLSRSTAGIQFIYRWQPTLGYLAPFYQFNTSVQANEYGVDQRDSTVANTQLFMTKRLSDDLTLVAGVSHYLEDSEGSVFDLEHGRMFLNMDYSPNSRDIYYAGYSYRRGEIWSVAQRILCNGDPADDIFPLIAAAEEIEQDQAFSNTFCGDWTAYRLDADTQTLQLGVNIPVGNKSALDFSVVWIDAEEKGRKISYKSTVIRASYLVRL